MCNKAEKDCYITHLYDVLAAKTDCVDCIEPKKDNYLGEIDRICRGLPCFKRFFPCDEKVTGPGSCGGKDPLPCIPYEVCLEQIYEQCRNDPEAAMIMNHLMEKLRRRDAEREQAKKMMNVKELVKELSDFYNAVAGVPAHLDLYMERLRAEEERHKEEAFQQRMKEHEITPEELAKLDENLKARRREGKAKAEEQRLEKEAIKRAAEEAATLEAAEVAAAAKKLQLATAANAAAAAAATAPADAASAAKPGGAPSSAAKPATAPPPPPVATAATTAAAASSSPSKPSKATKPKSSPAKLAEAAAAALPESAQTPDPQPSLKVKAGSKEAKEIAKTASQKNRNATENKDRNPPDTVSEPWAEKNKNLRNILPKSFKKKRGHDRDHKKSPWSWNDKLYDVRYHPPINENSAWSPKSQEHEKIKTRTFREELESVPHAVKPIRESLQLKPLSAEWRTLIKRYSIKQMPE